MSGGKGAAVRGTGAAAAAHQDGSGGGAVVARQKAKKIGEGARSHRGGVLARGRFRGGGWLAQDGGEPSAPIYLK